jgi:uncharacterized protein (TIGR02266 family)
MENRRIADLVSEFVPLNRRRVQGNPPLSVLELERWSALRDLIAYEFGHAPPVGRMKQPRHLRVPTHLKVRYGSEPEQSATLSNLSEGGLFVRCAEPLAVDMPIRLELELEGEPPLELDAVVVHTRESDNMDGPAGFGVAFKKIEAEDYAVLTRLIERALSGAAQRSPE